MRSCCVRLSSRRPAGAKPSPPAARRGSRANAVPWIWQTGLPHCRVLTFSPPDNLRPTPPYELNNFHCSAVLQFYAAHGTSVQCSGRLHLRTPGILLRIAFDSRVWGGPDQRPSLLEIFKKSIKVAVLMLRQKCQRLRGLPGFTCGSSKLHFLSLF